MSHSLSGLNTYIMNNFLGGPKIIPCRITINFFKSLTLFFCFFLMYYFNTYNLTGFVYAALHGSYGILWLLKDLTFPDNSFK